MAAELERRRKAEADEAANKQYQKRLDKLLGQAMDKKQAQVEAMSEGWGWRRLRIFAKKTNKAAAPADGTRQRQRRRGPRPKK